MGKQVENPLSFEGRAGANGFSSLECETPLEDRKSIEEDLFRCVRRSYDITRDDTDLRAFVGNRDFAKHFDALRKRYPVRHEFGDYTVTNVPKENIELREKLALLGFAVE